MHVSSLPKAVIWKRTNRDSKPWPFGSWASALPLHHTGHNVEVIIYNLYFTKLLLISCINTLQLKALTLIWKSANLLSLLVDTAPVYRLGWVWLHNTNNTFHSDFAKYEKCQLCWQNKETITLRIKSDRLLTRDMLNAPWLLTNRQFQWTGNGHSQSPLAELGKPSPNIDRSAPLVQTGEQFFTVWPWHTTLTYNPG